LKQISPFWHVVVPHWVPPPLELVLEAPLLELPVAPLDVLLVVVPLDEVLVVLPLELVVVPLELVVVPLELVVLVPVLLLVVVGPLVFLPPVPVVPPPLPFDAEEPQAATAPRMRIEVPRIRKEVMTRTIDENRRPGSSQRTRTWKTPFAPAIHTSLSLRPKTAAKGPDTPFAMRHEAPS
jgi:hypothetical protein